MKIGIVTTWFERGAAYVSKIYLNLLLKDGHDVFIYARGGEDSPSKKAVEWNKEYVTRDERYRGFNVNKSKFRKWLKKNAIEAILFNEQQDFRIVCWTKKHFPHIKIGAYVDYYTERTIPWFNIYDFVICNTKRHMDAMKGHKQPFYVRWGTDIDLFNTRNQHSLTECTVFFHSVGMSARKGTDILISAFINGELYKRSKLIIHTQIPIEKVCGFKKTELEQYNIDVIEKTVTAPGLYYLGDVYVYPTKLDGLGLTMYEALSCGLPVITTNFPPMNEAVPLCAGRYVAVKDYYCRQDGYFFPMAVCDECSLIEQMRWYIDNPSELNAQKQKARQYAEEFYNIDGRFKEVSNCFLNSVCYPIDLKLSKDISNYYKRNRKSLFDCLANNRLVYNLAKRILKKT
jgi:glycosyltransferase involved in cell wall biosynthesis